jgi:hypothetical protein
MIAAQRASILYCLGQACSRMARKLEDIASVSDCTVEPLPLIDSSRIQVATCSELIGCIFPFSQRSFHDQKTNVSCDVKHGDLEISRSFSELPHISTTWIARDHYDMLVTSRWFEMYETTVREPHLATI